MKIVDEWTPKCFPSGGSVLKPDDIGRRTGNAPTEKMAEVVGRIPSAALFPILDQNVYWLGCMHCAFPADVI